MVETDYAPGGGYDAEIPYDSWAPGDGYLDTPAQVFDAPAEMVAWGGSSDPYGSPMVSTSDIVRSRDAGTPYPASPITTVPPNTGDASERSGLNSLFKGVVDVFGKTAVTLAGSLAANALERVVPGKPASSATKASSPVHGSSAPAQPYVLPSFLGGGTFSSMSPMVLIFAAVGFVLLLILARR